MEPKEFEWFAFVRGTPVFWQCALKRPRGMGLLDPTCWYWHGLDAANDEDRAAVADHPSADQVVQQEPI